MYNIGDMLGKFLGGFRKYYNFASMTSLLFFRFVFIATFILIAINYDNNFIRNDYFAYVNLLLFALLNGYLT